MTSVRRVRSSPADQGRGHTSANGPLLTADQLAARWQVPKSWVYAATRDRRIPAVRLGRYYRYRLDAIVDFELEGGFTDD